ncbi:MAG: SigE family RNA polymerase sigma factor [Actinomycetales bacterium]|nr:SigE family RNA polymerase sigma factor [Actinomycetales bacterium]
METVIPAPGHSHSQTRGHEPDGLVVALFRTEAARLVGLARFFVQDRTAAEDLVQEAFIRLSRSLGRIDDETKAAAYLRSIVVNLARDHNRRGLMSFRHRPPARSPEPSAEHHVTQNESRAEVVGALQRLPLRQRDCLVLRYYLDLSVDEIAETLGIGRNSVKTHLQRGLRAMEASLEGRQ